MSSQRLGFPTHLNHLPLSVGFDRPRFLSAIHSRAALITASIILTSAALLTALLGTQSAAAFASLWLAHVAFAAILSAPLLFWAHRSPWAAWELSIFILPFLAWSLSTGVTGGIAAPEKLMDCFLVSLVIPLALLVRVLIRNRPMWRNYSIALILIVCAASIAIALMPAAMMD